MPYGPTGSLPCTRIVTFGAWFAICRDYDFRQSAVVIGCEHRNRVHQTQDSYGFVFVIIPRPWQQRTAT
jgi:hypothetical protein